MKKFSCLCAILTLLPVFLAGCRRLEFDNVTPCENKITRSYSKEKNDGLVNEVEASGRGQ